MIKKEVTTAIHNLYIIFDPTGWGEALESDPTLSTSHHPIIPTLDTLRSWKFLEAVCSTRNSPAQANRWWWGKMEVLRWVFFFLIPRKLRLRNSKFVEHFEWNLWQRYFKDVVKNHEDDRVLFWGNLMDYGSNGWSKIHQITQASPRSMNAQFFRACHGMVVERLSPFLLGKAIFRDYSSSMEGMVSKSQKATNFVWFWKVIIFTPPRPQASFWTSSTKNFEAILPKKTLLVIFAFPFSFFKSPGSRARLGILAAERCGSPPPLGVSQPRRLPRGGFPVATGRGSVAAARGGVRPGGRDGRVGWMGSQKSLEV